MIGFSTADSISDTLLCGRLDKSRVLVSDRHVQIEFSARFRWREDGFIASYQGVTNDVTGKHKLPNSAPQAYKEREAVVTRGGTPRKTGR